MKGTLSNILTYVMAFCFLLSPISIYSQIQQGVPIQQDQLQSQLNDIKAKIATLQAQKAELQTQANSANQQENQLFFTDAFNSRLSGDAATELQDKIQDIDNQIQQLQQQQQQLEMYLD